MKTRTEGKTTGFAFSFADFLDFFSQKGKKHVTEEQADGSSDQTSQRKPTNIRPERESAMDGPIDKRTHGLSRFVETKQSLKAAGFDL